MLSVGFEPAIPASSGFREHQPKNNTSKCKVYNLTLVMHCFHPALIFIESAIHIGTGSQTLRPKFKATLRLSVSQSVMVSSSSWGTWPDLCLHIGYFFPPVALRHNAGQGLLILEVSRPHTTTHHMSVGLLWTSDHLVAETSTWQHTTLTTDKPPCPWWDSNPRSQQASDRRPTS